MEGSAFGLRLGWPLMHRAQHGRCLGLLTGLVQLICFIGNHAQLQQWYCGWVGFGVGDLDDDTISSLQKKHRLEAIRVELHDDSI